jgi:triphosphoribosyl-dephospho-CoA synthase
VTPGAIAEAFRAACLIELQALKPGNVHVHAAGHGMTVSDFERSADAAAPWIAAAGLRVGARILKAVEATRAAVGMNTNLGIVLLAAPLAAAAETATAARGALRPALARVLDELDVEDAEAAFAAIRLAGPAGLGEAPAHDVRAPAAATLLDAMRAAAARDRIAHQYATAYADVFGPGLAALAAAEAQLGPGPWAAASLHLAFLAAVPDSHVARKHGCARAREVMAQARRLLARIEPGPAAETEFLAFDAALKAAGLNPGTTADLTVATLFAARLQDALGAG